MVIDINPYRLRAVFYYNKKCVLEYVRKIDYHIIKVMLSSYKGHMLLLHGDKDSTVPISWSENVKQIIPDCEFHPSSPLSKKQNSS